MMKCNFRSRSTRRGAVSVEMALVLPLCLVFLLGIMEYGRFLMTLQVFTNAAREGAHYAVSHTQPVVIGATTYGNATSDVTTIINKALTGQTLAGQSINVYCSDSVGNNLGTWTSTQLGQCICVQITGNYSTVITTMLRLNATIPVTATAVMRSEVN